jgi:surfeit locus 1 family protein
LCLFGVFFSLGLWQLDRFDQKSVLADRIAKTASGETQIITGRIDAPTDYLLSHVRVSGEFVEPVILLDSKKYQGDLGHHVVVPLKLSNTDQHLLINLGWQAGKAEDFLDEIVVPQGVVELEGQIGTAEKGFRPGFNYPGSEQGGVWIYLDPAYLAEHQGYEVLPLVMRLKTALTDELVRDWPVIEPDPGMHIGYAIQWFSFAAILAVFYGWRIRVYLKTKA